VEALSERGGRRRGQVKARGALEEVHCPECGEVRICEITSTYSTKEGRPTLIYYLCSREHRFEVKNPAKKDWPDR
jgi:hypothetical protein